MKDLRQMVRRSGLLATGKRRRRSLNSRRSDATHRRLRSETLEKRNLLAGGILASQNFNPYDVNDDGMISVRDALGVVNFLARSSGEGEQGGLTSGSNGTPGFHYDVNGDNNVSAADALGVINALARAEGEPVVTPIMETYTEDDGPFQRINLLAGQAGSGTPLEDFVDITNVVITGNINVVTSDAVLFTGPNPGAGQVNEAIIFPLQFSELNDGESSRITITYDVIDTAGDRVENTATVDITGITDQEIEYIVTVRDLNDNEIVPVNGVVSVGVDQQVYVQVAYEDLRSPSLRKDLGIFQLITNLTFDNTGAITPILNESQLLDTEGSVIQNLHGVRFSIPNLPPGVVDDGTHALVYELSAPDLVASGLTFPELVEEALSTFGYETDQYRLADENGAQRVIFTDPAFGNADLPDITYEVLDLNGNVNQDGLATGKVTVTPALINGLPNSDAVPYSIDFRSNTFDNPVGFGEPFYSNLLDRDAGSYDPATGFIAVGGLGKVPGKGGGVPEEGDFGEPMDSFSLKVTVNQPDVDVVASVDPAVTENEFMLLYGYDNQRIPENVVAESVEGGLGQEPGNANNGIAKVTLSTKTPNVDPTTGGELEKTFSENDNAASVDLLEGADDPDGNNANLVVNNFMLDPSNTGNAGGIMQNAQDPTLLDVDPSFYGFLNDNESEVVIYNYDVVDERGGSVAQKVTITITGVTNPNAPPQIELNQSFTIAENTQAPTSVGTVIANDPEMGPLTYAIVGGNAGNAFEIDANNGELKVLTDSAIDFETNPTFPLSIRVTDNGGQTDTETVTVNLTDINEDPVVNDQTFSVNETAGQGTVFGTVAATDPEGVALTYTVLARDDNGVLALSDSGVLSVAQAPLTPNSTFKLTVEVSDGTLTDTAEITVNVTDLPEPPTVNDQTFDVDENSAAGTAVDTVVANDPDGDALTYTITDGNTGGAFAINSSTGAITVAGSLNFEQLSTYSLTVRVADPGGLNDTATITINVNDLNEAPTVANQTFSIPEDATIGSVVGTIQASDPDAGDDLTYAIAGGSGVGVFSLDGDSGQVTTAAALDFENVSQYTLNVTVTDLDGLSDPADITINITNVNEAPIVGDAIDEQFSEDDDPANVSLLTGTIDPDGNNNLLTVQNFRLVSGTAAGISLVGTSLAVNPDANGDLVTGNRINVYNFDIVDAGGASTPQSATITINGVNDTPNARDDSRSAIVDQVVVVDVLDNDDVGDGENGTPTLVGAVLDAGSVGDATIDSDTNTGLVTVTPTLGFEGVVKFSYTMTDGDLQASATAEVTYRNFDVSTISGLVFEDTLENGIDVALNGADEIRNGVKDGDEAGFAGLTVALFSSSDDNVTGEEIRRTATTDTGGAYHFGDLPPGDFRLELLDVDPDLLDDQEDALKFGRSGGIVNVSTVPVQQVSIDNPLGGETITGVDWHVTSKDPALDTNNLIASGNHNQSQDENGNQKGLFALLDEDGKQVFVGVLAGFEGVDEVKLSYDVATDQAILEVLDEGVSRSRILTEAEYELTEGDKMQVFGGLDDLFADDGGDDDDAGILAS